MKKDFILTFLAQLIILFSGLAVFKLAIVAFGEAGFSEFSLMKRNSTYLYAFVILGLSVAIPKFIAMERGAKSGDENSAFLASLIVMLCSLMVTGLLLGLFEEQISYLLFGDRSFVRLLYPLFVSVIGLSLGTMVYAYYRGKMLFNYSNLVQILNLGVIPLVVFLFSENIEQLYLYMGLLMSLLSLILLTQIFLSQKFELQRVKDFIPKVFIYGLQRLPADFGIASLIALPAIFAAHSEGFVTAGYVAFSVSLLSLSGQVVAPIGLVMLPKISHLLGEKNFTMIRHYVKKLLLISLFVALFGTVIYQLFAKEILSLYLGSAITPELVNISKNILWGALFYPLYVTLRSVVDGYYDRAYNTISIFAALILFVVLFFAGTKVHFALNAALALLALMTLYFIKPLLMRVKS